MGKWGGAQPNAGRPLGGHNKATLERRQVEKELHQAIMNKANRLLKIMMYQAEGDYFLIRIDMVEDGKKKKKEHITVTSGTEIRKFFNEHAQNINSQDELDGLNGKVDNNYYYIKKKEADWRAIESLLDRVFGKSTQHISTDDGDNEKENYEQLNGEQLDRHIDELRKRIKKIRKNKGKTKQNTDDRGIEESITEKQKE